MQQKTPQEVWLVYDGDCPICGPAANALKIRAAVGKLNLVNARNPHPILEEIKQAGLDIDQGMVVKINNTLYHGADAQHVLAMIGTTHDFVNRMNVWLFRSKLLSKIFYPIMRSTRNILIWRKGISKLHNLYPNDASIFQTVFGADWLHLPNVMKLHYSNRPFSNDVINAQGSLDIQYSGLFLFLLPILQFAKILIAYRGKDIPVKIAYKSDFKSNAFRIERIFNLPNNEPRQFVTTIIPIKKNYVLEVFGFGFAWRSIYSLQDNKIIQQHNGYALRLFACTIPLPLTWLFGKIHAEETALSHNEFSMRMEIIHPLLGNYSYHGKFKILNP